MPESENTQRHGGNTDRDVDPRSVDVVVGRRFDWTIVMAIAVAVFVIVALLIPVPSDGRAARSLGDLMHAPLFAGLAMGILALLERLRPVSARALTVRLGYVGIGLFVFGVAIEFLQVHSGRTASLHDAIANGLGILVGVSVFLAWKLSFRDSAKPWYSYPLVLIALIALSVAWWSPLNTLWDVARTHLDFPMLASFESEAELERFYFGHCRARIIRRDVTEGRQAMEITYDPTPSPTATLVELHSDWSAMKTLEVDVALDASHGEPVRFLLKVIDRKHQGGQEDTFRREWKLEPGRPTHLRVTREEVVNGPDTRKIDLAEVSFVDLVVLEPGRTTRIRVDALRLTL